jgi:uncharacterized protein (DUF305 family)
MFAVRPLLVAGALLAGAQLAMPAHAVAAETHSGHGTAAAASPASEAYSAAMDRMHKDMAMAPTGDADVDFARGMIPHHQAAIDMAKVQLRYGKDPEIRRLAEAVIKAQEAEINQLKAWLEKRGQ